MSIESTRANLSAIAIVASICAAPVASAQSSKVGSSDKTQPQQVAVVPATHKPACDKVAAGLYVPPSRSAPERTIASGTRGSNQDISVVVLAPNESALTTSDQPTLYWYVSGGWPHGVVVTVVHREADEPLLEIDVPSPTRAGIQFLRLADHNVHLAAGQRYQWGVALVDGSGDRRKDIYTQGGIEWRPSPSLRDRLEVCGPEQKAQLFAGEGMWYDAIDALSQSMEQAPVAPALREQRNALLRQVGLELVADHDQ